ncbi:MAG: hypothetical protein A2Y38_01680 [Spirochaetes bacterium GWB1_59_5]|nr:MAG: hypothetical protein A2Y38_01680 [Spirochaetes bacterium GWB1_59_5]
MNVTIQGGEAWIFAQVDDFWERYQPLTPWGKDEAEARIIFSDREVLERRYDDIDSAIGFMRALAGDPSSLDRVSYHLKRMPRMTLEPKGSYELIELFQIKKFMANYRGVRTALGDAVAGAFGLAPFEPGSAAQTLAAALDQGGSDPETFYLADSYDGELAEARAGLAAADAVVVSERAKAEAEARLSFGVSFDGREFVVAPKDSARAMLASCGNSGEAQAGRYAVEPYDDARYIVRLLPSPSAVEALADRERWLAAERLAEERVVARLSALAMAAMPELALAVAATACWDRARAGADLTLRLGMVRPLLESDDTRLAQARFTPCADECERMGLSYSPLNAEFRADAVVLFGSNMGGKTVVLKTILFFQLVAQAGLFVPAQRFETRVYDRIEYVGELSGERLAGLSGFGLEVWRLIAASASAAAWAADGACGTGRGALVAFDELARTTGSHEAEALLSAVVEAYAGGRNRAPGNSVDGNGADKAGGFRTSDRAFFATHFRGVARLPGAEYRRMRGLDRAATEAALNPVAGSEPEGSIALAACGDGPALAERLAGINRHMRYEVVDDDGSGSESDALAIASLLGLDRNIVDRARYYLTKDGA